MHFRGLRGFRGYFRYVSWELQGASRIFQISEGLSMHQEISRGFMGASENLRRFHELFRELQEDFGGFRDISGAFQ